MSFIVITSLITALLSVAMPSSGLAADTAGNNTSQIATETLADDINGASTTGVDAGSIDVEQEPLRAANTGSSQGRTELRAKVGMPADNVLLDTTGQRFISSGKRLDIESKGLSITPLAGWEINLGFPGTTLLMQPPEKRREKYRRTVQIISLNGGRYIDDIEAETIADYIVRNFSTASSEIRSYRIRNYLPVSLNDGTEGYLFYTSFKVRETELMQMHVVVSSAAHHFIMTYTDLAAHFDTDASQPSLYLDEAWQTIGSVTLRTSGPSRFTTTFLIYGLCFLLLVLGIAYGVYRNKRAKTSYDEYASSAFDDEDSDLMTHSGPETATHDEQLIAAVEVSIPENEIESGADDVSATGESDDYLERRTSHLRGKGKSSGGRAG